jgi:microcystin degradation protein MlrC
MPRFLVGQLWQESHDFNPVPTRASDFAVERGAEMLAANGEAGSTLGGILRTLQAAGVRMVPTLAARARPGGQVDADVYRDLRDAILTTAAAAGPLDGAVFELHGAMTARGEESPEADLMGRLRKLLGPHAVIAVGLDLHAHVTDALLAACDIVTACKQNPHSDVVDAGERAARLALDTLAGRIRPVMSMVKLPMLLTGGSETVDRPLADLHAIARAATDTDARLLDVSIFNVHPFRDVADLGQAVVAIADGDAAAADAAALAVARPMWAWRERFTHEFPDADSALDAVMDQAARRPFVLGDRGDRVLAGAPGDGLHLLARLRARGLKLRGAFPVTDPATAAAAIAAGPGAILRRQVGGGVTPGFAPLLLDLRVIRTDTSGSFVQKGPYQAGQRSMLGPCAVLEDDRGNTVLATTAAAMTQDPAAFTSQGIGIGSFDLIVAKSGNHFKLSFAGVATPLVVDTPGMSTYRPGFFPYSRSRPWPEDPGLTLPHLTLRRFGAGVAPRETVPA